MTEDPFKSCYKVGSEKIFFGDKFLYTKTHYVYGEENLIADVVTKADGIRIKVFVTAMPARFWSFVIDNEFVINTGSGNWKDYKNVFELIISDMLEVCSYVES